MQLGPSGVDDGGNHAGDAIVARLIMGREQHLRCGPEARAGELDGLPGIGRGLPAVSRRAVLGQRRDTRDRRRWLRQVER